MHENLRASIAALLTAVPGFAQVVSYEADSFPENAGWERIERLFPPERSVSNGWFELQCEVVAPERCEGEDEYYRWSLADWAGVPRLFAEWRVVTNGPRSEIPDVAPIAFVLGGRRGIWFHTTVARDQARFLIDVRYPFWAELQPNMAHRFRVDIFGEYWYEWSVDGKVHVAGRPEKAYPTADSVIVWGARAACVDSVSAFDHIRFGRPEEVEIDCDAVRKLKARCREGHKALPRIVAKVRTGLDEGTELTLTNNGDHRLLVIDPRGRAKAKYKRQEPGEHTILLLNCPPISRVVSCQ